MAVAAAANACREGEGLVGSNKAVYGFPRVLPIVTLATVFQVIVAIDASLSVTNAPSSNTV